MRGEYGWSYFVEREVNGMVDWLHKLVYEQGMSEGACIYAKIDIGKIQPSV